MLACRLAQMLEPPRTQNQWYHIPEIYRWATIKHQLHLEQYTMSLAIYFIYQFPQSREQVFFLLLHQYYDTAKKEGGLQVKEQEKEGRLNNTATGKGLEA